MSADLKKAMTKSASSADKVMHTLHREASSREGDDKHLLVDSLHNATKTRTKNRFRDAFKIALFIMIGFWNNTQLMQVGFEERALTWNAQTEAVLMSTGKQIGVAWQVVPFVGAILAKVTEYTNEFPAFVKSDISGIVRMSGRRDQVELNNIMGTKFEKISYFMNCVKIIIMICAALAGSSWYLYIGMFGFPVCLIQGIREARRMVGPVVPKPVAAVAEKVAETGQARASNKVMEAVEAGEEARQSPAQGAEAPEAGEAEAGEGAEGAEAEGAEAEAEGGVGEAVAEAAAEEAAGAAEEKAAEAMEEKAEEKVAEAMEEKAEEKAAEAMEEKAAEKAAEAMEGKAAEEAAQAAGASGAAAAAQEASASSKAPPMAAPVAILGGSSSSSSAQQDVEAKEEIRPYEPQEGAQEGGVTQVPNKGVFCQCGPMVMPVSCTSSMVPVSCSSPCNDKRGSQMDVFKDDERVEGPLFSRLWYEQVGEDDWRKKYRLSL